VQKRELDVLFVGTRFAMLFLLPLFISDVGIYQNFAHNLFADGKLPYVGWDFEYPPLALPFVLIPGLVSKLLHQTSTESFRIVFGALILPFDFLLYRAFLLRPPIKGAAFAYVTLTSALGLLLYDRFDIAVGFALAWPFLTNPSEERFWLSWGLGGALKLVPLVVAPTRVLDWEGSNLDKLKRLVIFGVLSALPLLLCVATVAAVAGGKISFFSHHSDRGVQVESLIASGVMLLQAFTGLINVGVDNNFGAQHLAEIPGLVLASRILFFGSLIGSFAALWCDRARRDSLSAAWLLMLGFVTFGYVLSPQFLLWLLPLGICAASRIEESKRGRWLAVFSWTIIFTGVHFRFYWDYVHLHQLAVLMLVTRNVLLVGLWGLSWAWMRPEKARVSESLTAAL